MLPPWISLFRFDIVFELNLTVSRIGRIEGSNQTEVARSIPFLVGTSSGVGKTGGRTRHPRPSVARLFNEHVPNTTKAWC